MRGICGIIGTNKEAININHNTKIMNVRGVLFVLASVIGGAVLSVSVAHAQGLNVEVSPGKINRMVEPGEMLVQTFRVGNYSDSDRTFYIYAQDFTVSSTSGAPSFDTAQVDPRYSLSQWISLPSDRVFVPAGEVRTVDVTIRVPEAAEQGGHYGAFFVQTDDPSFIDQQEGSVIGSVGRIASLMLITVPGDVVEDVAVDQFQTDQKIYWNSAPDIAFTAMLKNNGTVHAIPTGAVFLSGGIAFKGQNVIFNKEQGAVLPGAPERHIVEKVQLRKTSLVPPMGKFDAQFLAKYGVGNGELAAGATFYVIPVKFLAGLFAVIFVVLFVFYRAFLSFGRKT